MLWSPAFFGVKPDLVVKIGNDRRGLDGRSRRLDPDSGSRCITGRCSALTAARLASAVMFLPAIAIEARRGAAARAATGRHAGRGIRAIDKSRMVHNAATPRIEVDPETYEVRADGVLLTCEPATVLPLAQRYFLVETLWPSFSISSLRAQQSNPRRRPRLRHRDCFVADGSRNDGRLTRCGGRSRCTIAASGGRRRRSTP